MSVMSEILASSASMRVEYFYDINLSNRNLSFIFSPSMNRNLEGNGYGGEVLLRNGYDTIAFKVTNDDWFQQIPPEVFTLIARIVAKKNYEKKLAYGSSMGGYAAIAFSKLLECDKALVFSPQQSIDEAFDRRWEIQSKEIVFKYRISADSISKSCQFIILYDNKDLDQLHVERLSQIINPSNLQLIKLPLTGHPSIMYLSEVGALKDLLLNIINDVHVVSRSLLASRRDSKSYLKNLSYELAYRKKFRYALSIINSAISINELASELYIHKAKILDKMGVINEAISCAEHSILIDPKNYHHLAVFSDLLDKNGFIDRAIEMQKQAVHICPNNPNLNGHLNKMLAKKSLLT